MFWRKKQKLESPNILVLGEEIEKLRVKLEAALDEIAFIRRNMRKKIFSEDKKSDEKETNIKDNILLTPNGAII